MMARTTSRQTVLVTIARAANKLLKWISSLHRRGPQPRFNTKGEDDWTGGAYDGSSSPSGCTRVNDQVGFSTTPIMRSVVVLGAGFSPLLLRPGVISSEIVGAEAPQAVTTPVLSQLTYPSGFQLTLTDDTLQVAAERDAARELSWEDLSEAAKDFLRRNELIPYRAVGFNALVLLSSGDGEFRRRLRGRYFSGDAFASLSGGLGVNDAVTEASFDTAGARCRVRFEWRDDAEGQAGVRLNVNIHYDVAGWDELREVLDQSSRATEAFQGVLQRVAVSDGVVEVPS